MKYIDYCMDLDMMLICHDSGEITAEEFCTALDRMCSAMGTEFLVSEILTRMPDGIAERLDRITEIANAPGA